MIAYFLRLCIKNTCNALKNIWITISFILLSFISIFYGFLTAFLINKDLDDFIPEYIIRLVFFIIFILTIVRLIFPSYKPMKRILPTYYPVNQFRKYLLSLFSELFSFYYFYLLFYIISCSIFLEYDNGAFFLEAICTLLSAYFIRRFIQYPIDYKLKKFGYYASLFFIVLSIIGLWVISSYIIGNLFLVCLAPIFMFFIGYIIDCSVIEKKISIKKSLMVGNDKNIYFRILVNNSTLRVPLLIAFAFKMAILIIDFISFKIENQHLFEGIIYWLFASPLILYIYAFNNMWLFVKELWLSMELNNGCYKYMIRIGLKLQAIPLLIDALITIPFLFFGGEDIWIALIIYFFSIVYLSFSSFLWSLLFPKHITTLIQRPSTSYFSIIFSATGIFIIYGIKINNLFFSVIPIIILASVLFLKLSINLYKRTKYNIFNIIKKTE